MSCNQVGSHKPKVKLQLICVMSEDEERETVEQREEEKMKVKARDEEDGKSWGSQQEMKRAMPRVMKKGTKKREKDKEHKKFHSHPGIILTQTSYPSKCISNIVSRIKAVAQEGCKITSSSSLLLR